MNREDFISVIEAVEGILKIEEACICLSGSGLDQGEGNSVYVLWDVLRRNSASRYQKNADIDEDSESYEAFVEVLYDKELSAEEKYEKLVA